MSGGGEGGAGGAEKLVEVGLVNVGSWWMWGAGGCGELVEVGGGELATPSCSFCSVFFMM